MNTLNINGIILKNINETYPLKNLVYSLYISKDGKFIYNSTTNKMLCVDDLALSRYGYKRTSLTTIHGVRKEALIHRLVMYAWGDKPPENMIDPTIDHIDGNKTNNDISNLRWMERAINTKIQFNRPIGSRLGCSKYTEQQVEMVCSFLEQIDNDKLNMSLNVVSNLTGVSRSTIEKIHIGEVWTHISSKYNLKPNIGKSINDRTPILNEFRDELKRIILFNPNMPYSLYKSSIYYNSIIKCGFYNSVKRKILRCNNPEAISIVGITPFDTKTFIENGVEYSCYFI